MNEVGIGNWRRFLVNYPDRLISLVWQLRRTAWCRPSFIPCLESSIMAQATKAPTGPAVVSAKTQKLLNDAWLEMLRHRKKGC